MTNKKELNKPKELITNLDDALRYCVKHKYGNLNDLKKIIHPDLIKSMALTGLINADYD